MRPLFLLCVICCAVARAPGQTPTEPEAYSKVCRARERAVRLRTPDSLACFEENARGFLTAHPSSERGARVRAWLRELRRTRPAPELIVDGWVGEPVDPTRADGEVTALVFFSVTHPQTAWLLPRLVRFERRLGCQGLRVVGIASVVDDRDHQGPRELAARLRELELPFAVAVDRQRTTGPSLSFAGYGGDALPWVALVDRYGRLAWTGDAREPARLERAAARLLAEPALDELTADVRAGKQPLARLTEIHTMDAVTALFDLMQNQELRDSAREALETVGPRGYDLSNPRAARARWLRERAGYAFSPNAGRVVKRS